MKKLLISFGLILGTLGLGLQAIHAEGIVEDKDTIEDRGPGNLDVPEEKTPKTPKEEAKEAPKEKATETISPQPTEDKVPSENTSDQE